jgi:hypothetical protein
MHGMDMKTINSNRSHMETANTGAIIPISTDSTENPMNDMNMSPYLNSKTSGFTILFEGCTITTTLQFVILISILFTVSFSSDLLGRYKFKRHLYNTRYLLALQAFMRSFINALLMLAMMSFNFYIILVVVLGTGVSHFVMPSRILDEQQIC